MPNREPSSPSPRCQLLAGTIAFDDFVHLILLCFEPSSLSADRAVELLFLVDYIRAELCAAHHDTFRGLLCGDLEPDAIF